jgi:hypothetical protein
MLQSEEDEEITEAGNKAVISCSGRRCSANEHCCPGTVCVDLDGRKLKKKKKKLLQTYIQVYRALYNIIARRVGVAVIIKFKDGCSQCAVQSTSMLTVSALDMRIEVVYVLDRQWLPLLI